MWRAGYPERLIEQRKEIDAAQAALGDAIVLLQGSEVEIHADGSLDFEDEVLASLDFVTASLHSSLRQERALVTERLLHAIRNPHVDMIGHPSGRLLPNREGADLDMDAILKAARDTGTALEINASPYRLDLDETYRAGERNGHCHRDQHGCAQACRSGSGEIWGIRSAPRLAQPRRGVEYLAAREIAGLDQKPQTGIKAGIKRGKLFIVSHLSDFSVLRIFYGSGPKNTSLPKAINTTREARPRRRWRFCWAAGTRWLCLAAAGAVD